MFEYVKNRIGVSIFRESFFTKCIMLLFMHVLQYMSVKKQCKKYTLVNRFIGYILVRSA